MSSGTRRKEMKMRDIVHRRCCGLDVHKDQIAACVRWAEDNGEIEQETRVFGTTTEQLRSMGNWMRGHGVQLVAMESTGVYWRPVWNVLEGDFELKLANSQHIRNIPGKKTDKKDGAWIAKLLQHDLVPASFVPDTRIQELRELTRARARLVQEKTAVANRIQDVLENANIKLASVASDILGRSGRAMLEAIIGGESDPARLADLAKAQLRSKIQRLRLALEGRIREHHRFSLRQLMDHLEFLEGKIFIIEEELRRRSQPYEEAIQFWMTIPGVRWLIAVTLVAEIGVDMKQFPSAAQLASWAGVCPGNNESGGKRKSGKTRKGSVWLRRALCEAAWAASRTRNTYLSAQYRRIAAKRGQKRASLAVAHTILVIAYHLLKNKVRYHELGGDYFDRIRTAGLKRYYLKRLEQLGVSIIESPAVSGG
jgi:transposase